MAINNPIVTDSEWLQATAVAIQNKDGGSKMEVPDFASRIEALPLEQNFDMTVTENQVKMIIEVNDNDLSLWTRFGQTANSTVTVDWGDGTQDVYTESEYRSLEYATQRKHQYQKAGRYLVTETITDGSLTIGAVNAHSTLSEGVLAGNYKNAQDNVRQMYNYKVKELSFGDSITVSGLQNIPFVIIHNDINFICSGIATDYIVIKEGTGTIGSYWFNGCTAYSIKIPSSVNFINNNAFDSCWARIIDFTDMELTEQGELPFSISATNVFRGSSSTRLLFKTQEIAEVAKNTTNLSVYASRIKYEGEEY